MRSRRRKTRSPTGTESHSPIGNFRHMGSYGLISSIESLPLPEGPHVRDFDSRQKAAKQAARAAKRAGATGARSATQATGATPMPATPEPGATKESQALDSNASASQALAHDSAVSGEYVDSGEPAKSEERKVEPLSRGELSDPRTTMARLHEMSAHDLSVLDALNNEGRQIIRTRLMAIWDEMSVRFERGESINGISGTGGKGMGKYLRSLGIDPAKRRSWKFEIGKQDILRLTQESPLRKRGTKKKEIVIHSETEADLIAQAGVRMAQQLVGDSAMPPQERINKAEASAKEILNAIEDGQY